MTHQANGTFEVNLAPLALADNAADPMLGRMSIDKQFRGELDATSRGEMLTAGTATRGSAGYVAIEKVSGSLQGRSGSFVLHHLGTMTRGNGHLSVHIVPDSGTGQLSGITGEMRIRVADGKHYYELDYSLPDGL